MTFKRWTLWGVAALVVVATALGSTYLMLDRCSLGRCGTSLDVANARRWVHELKLTGDQEAKLAPLETALQKDLDPLQLKLAEERMAVCGLLGDDKSDEKQLESAVGRVADLEAQQQRRIVRHLWDMRSILTPPQRGAFFASLMQSVCENCRMPMKGGMACCAPKGRMDMKGMEHGSK